jgi:hypothetical protein
MCVYHRPGGAVDFEKNTYNIYIYIYIYIERYMYPPDICILLVCMRVCNRPGGAVDFEKYA